MPSRDHGLIGVVCVLQVCELPERAARPHLPQGREVPSGRRLRFRHGRHRRPLRVRAARKNMHGRTSRTLDLREMHLRRPRCCCHVMLPPQHGCAPNVPPNVPNNRQLASRISRRVYFPCSIAEFVLRVAVALSLLAVASTLTETAGYRLFLDKKTQTMLKNKGAQAGRGACSHSATHRPPTT